MNTEYLKSLYEWIGQNDETFSTDIPFEQFTQKMQDPAYAKKMHDWVGTMDDTFVQDMPLDAFQNKIKNIQPQEEPSKKKELSDTTVSPLEGTSLALPSPQEAVQPIEEKPFFTGDFGNLLQTLKKSGQAQLASPIIGGIADLIDDMGRAIGSGYASGEALTPSLSVMTSGKSATPEQIRKFVEASKALEQTGPSEEMQSFQKTYNEEGNGWWGLVKGISLNPTVVPEIMLSTMSALANPASLATMGGIIGASTAAGAAGTFYAGGAGGLATGAASVPYAMAAANTLLETGGTFSELLQDEINKRGLEFNEESVKQVLEDSSALNSIRAKAVGRGITIGAIDAITGKVAGSVGAKITSKAGAAAAAAGIEAVGGSLGETAGRAVAGQKMDIAEIGLEGIGEMPGGVRDVVSEVLSKPSYKINGERRTAQDVDDIINSASPEDLANINFDIKRDKNGFNEKIQDKIVTNQIRTEIATANPDMDEESVNQITDLEKELRTLDGKKTYVAKEKAASIRERIKNIQKNGPEKVTTKEEENLQKINDRISEIEGMLSNDDESLADTGQPKLIPEARTGIENELQTLKEQRDAIQKPSTEEGVLRQEGPEMGLPKVGEGDQGQVAAEGTEAVPVEETEEVTETILSTPRTTMVALENLPAEERMTTTFLQEDGTESPVMGNENMLADLYHQAIGVAEEERTPSQQSVIDAVEVSLKTQLEEEAQVLQMQEMDRQAPSTISETTQPFAQTQVSGAADVSNDADMQDIQDRVSASELPADILDKKNTIIKAAKMAHKTLTSLFPDFKIYLHDNRDSYNFLMDEFKTDKDTGGNFAVFRNADGKIVGGRIDINLGRANLRTVAHEVTHAVLLKAFGDNPKLFNSFKNRLSVVIKSSDNTALKKFIAGYENADVRPEEYLSELTSMLANNETKIEPNVMQRILAVINDFIKRISGDKIAQFKNTSELVDFVNTISQKIAAGEEIDLRESEAKESKGKGIVSKSQTNETKPTTKSGNRLFNQPLKAVTEIADRYYERVFGEKRPRFNGTRGLDEARAKKIADAFIKMKHEPNNPKVRKAYKAMADETIEQYKALLDAGYFVEINNEEPYGNSQEMIDDLRDNKRMKIFSTESGFGDNPITDAQRNENPLLARTEFKDVNGQPLLVNDLFRAVHDFFGHAELGNSFGPKGEENAWNVHVRMYSPLAAKAMTTETRGQNSFVNFSGINEAITEMRDEARKLREQGKEEEAQAIVQKIYDEFKFADQKIGLLPDKFSKFDIKDEGGISVPTEKVSINEKVDTINDFPKPIEVKSKSQIASKGDNLVPEDWDIDEDGDGNFIFYHYGDVKGGEINPNYHGKNIYTSDKRANKVSYFYTRGGDKERMISGDPFVVKVPKNKVYPFNKDPLNFYDEAEAIFKKEYPYRTFDPVSQIDYMNPLISKAGYDIVVAKWEAFPLRAESVKPLQYDKDLTRQFRNTGTVTSKSQRAALDDAERTSRITGGKAYTDAIQSLKDILKGDDKFRVYGDERQERIDNIINYNILIPMQDKRVSQKITDIRGLANAIYNGAMANWNEIKNENISNGEYEEAMAAIRLAKEIKDNPKAYADELKAIAYKLKLPNWVDKQFKGATPYEVTSKSQVSGGVGGDVEIAISGKEIGLDYKDGEEGKYSDESVYGDIRIVGEDVEILDWNSKETGRGNTEKSLRKLKQKYGGEIRAVDVGYEGEKSYTYWQKMLDKGLIDGFYDDNSILHTNKSKSVEQSLKETPKAEKVTSKSQVASEVKEMEKKFVISKSQVEAYHGSPYDFDKFTTEKIGTGEGVQAFGWGLYFTDLKSIAETYKKAGVNSIYIDNKPLREIKKFKKLSEEDKDEVEVLIRDILDGIYTKGELFGDAAYRKGVYLTAYELIRDSKKITESPSAKLYQVSLHQGKTPEQYTWVQWDKPVSEELINKLNSKLDGKLNKSIDFVKEKYGDILGTISDGRLVYKAISRLLEGDKAASLFLLENGIDGVKFPAESVARGATSETARAFNYVVFDENAVTIISKSQQSASQAKRTIDKVIKDARAQGFSEEAIRTFLQKKGLTSDEIDLAMGREKGAATRVNINEQTMPGYDRVIGEIEGIVAKSNERGVSEKKTIQNVMDYLMGTKLYENATDVQREQLVRNISQAFGIRLKSAPSVGRILGSIKDVKNITMTDKELLIKEIKDYARGAKDATVAFMRASGQLSKAIKKMRSEGKITVGQAANILRKFSKVNMFNEESISKFVTYMAKVFNDAEYAEKISNVKRMLPVAKKNVLTKLGISKNLIPDLSRMLAVKPELIPDSVFETYQELVEMLGKRQQVLSLKDVQQVTEMANQVLNALNEEYSQADELKDVFNDYENKVFDEDGKLKYADTLAQMVKDNTITNEEAEILKKYKSLVVEKAAKVEMTEEEIAQEKEQLISGINNVEVDHARLPSRNERDLAERLAKLIRSGVLEKMDNEQLKNLLKVIDNINSGYLPHYAQVLVQRMNSLNNSGPLSNAITLVNELPLTKLYARFKSLFLRDKNYLDLMIGRSPLYYIDQVFGNFKGKEIFNSLFKQSSQANEMYSSRMNKIQNMLGKALEDVSSSFSNNPNKVRMSSYKMMAYALQLEHDSNIGAKGVYPAADFLKATIKHILAGKSHLGEDDAKMLQEILDNEDFRDSDGNISAEKIYASFNPAEKRALETIKKVNESVEQDAEYTASVIRGDKATMLSNYVHHNVMPDTRPDESISGITSANSMSENLRPSSRGKSLIERTTGLKPLDFNIFTATQRGANYVLMDYYLTEPIRTARMTINETENALLKDRIDELVSGGMTLEEAKQEAKLSQKDQLILNALNDAYEQVVKNILVNKMSTNSFADEVANFITKQGYRAVLASSLRWTSELSGNLGYVMLTDPKSYIDGWKNYSGVFMSPDAIDVLINLGSMQSERLFSSETLSGRMIDQSIMSQAAGVKGGKANGRIANVMQTVYNNSLKKGQNFVEATADTLITTPDKLMMRPLWFGAFASEFKKITGQDVDFEKIAANDEEYMKEFKEELDKARDVADDKSVMAGATDNAFMGVLKGTVQPNANNLAKAFNVFNNYMTRFMIYEYTTARTGLYASMGNGTISRKQGVALMAGVTTRMVLYSLLMNVLGTSLVKMATGQDDDDEDEKSFLQKAMQAIASGISGMILGRDFGNATKTLVNYGIEKVNEKYLDFLREGDYDPYKDALQYSAIPKETDGRTPSFADFIINMSGPVAPAAKTGQLIFKKMTEAPKKEQDAIERSEKEWNIRIPLEVAGNAGLVPLYKDIRKAVLANMYKDLKEAEKQNKIKKAEAQRDKVRLHGFKNKTDLKRYEPELYEQEFGEDSPMYEIEQAERDIEKEKRNLERQMKDEAYGYTPKEEKKSSGFGPSEGFGPSKKKESGFGPKSGFGPQGKEKKAKTTSSSSSFTFERGRQR